MHKCIINVKDILILLLYYHMPLLQFFHVPVEELYRNR